jgi:hypothetical protein
VDLPDVTIGDTPFGKLTVNPTGLVNIGGRVAISALALGLIFVGTVALAWKATPDEAKTAAVKAATAAA